MTTHETQRLRDSEGQVTRWVKTTGTWPGHRVFVSVEGLDVIIGDDFTDDALSQHYRCSPRAFVDGCFHDTIRRDFGADVLNEVLTLVRTRNLGLDTHTPRPAPRFVQPLTRRSTATPTPAKPATTTAVSTPQPRAKPTALTSKPVTAPKTAARKKKVATTKRTTKQATSTKASVTTLHCDLELTSWTRADLALVVALRQLTMRSAASLIDDLKQGHPFTLMTQIPRPSATSIQTRLTKYGATATVV